MNSASTSVSPGAVRIALAGELEVRARGLRLDGADLRGRRAKVAFARLALDAGRTVSRDVLADAVWGEQLPASWVPALRNVIAEVRRWLAAGGADAIVVLDAVGGGYRLSLPPGSTVDLAMLARDVQRAEELSRQGRHDRAMKIAEKALPTASISGIADANGEWAADLAAHVAELRVRLERVSGEAALAVGDAAHAERMARRLIESEPLREDGHRLLMRALAASGNRGEALRAYEACRQLLSDELGAKPSAPTEALHLEILAEE